MLPVLEWYTSLPHIAAAATTTTTATSITTTTTTTTTTTNNNNNNNNNVFWGFEFSQHVLYVLRPLPGVGMAFGKAGSCQRPDYGQESVSETPKYFTEFNIFNSWNDGDLCDTLFAMTCWH